MSWLFCHVFFSILGNRYDVTISVLRYRATVYHLKPAISRRKLKVVCDLVYIVSFFAGYGPAAPSCLEEYWEDGKNAHDNHFNGYITFCGVFCPTIFMAVVYFKIGRTLMKQNKYVKSMCSNVPGRHSASTSSFNIMTYFRNRKTFLVCLLTVVCYAVGNIPSTVWMISWMATDFRLLMKHSWIVYCTNILRVAGVHSVNHLIYETLDKKLLKFWKHRRTSRRRSPQQ